MVPITLQRGPGMIAYSTGHESSEKITHAFAAGAKAEVRRITQYEPDGGAFVHGLLRGGWWIIENCQTRGVDWYLGDNGYFRDARGERYYRITRNAMQHDGTGSARPERWQRLGLNIKRWRRDGRQIVVIPPPRIMGYMLGFSADAWLADTLARLKAATDRQIVVRDRMAWESLKKMAQSRAGPPLAQDLLNAWALVAHVSNCAVEAVVAGIPVFCTDPCAAYVMGTPDLSLIETPVLPEREQWAWNLAANQWSLFEISKGIAWRGLNEAVVGG